MILIFVTIVFLFCLFLFSKDDFILLRKNVAQTTIFDITFFVGIVSLFFSRLIFVASHFKPLYLNPLAFFVIPYFPGLSIFGGLLGGCFCLYLLAMRKILPLGKLFDIFTLSYTSSIPVFLAITGGVFVYEKNYFSALIYGVAFLVTIFFLILFQKIATKKSWRDGFLSLSLLTVITVIFIIMQFTILHFKGFPAEFPYAIAFLFILFLSFLISLFRRTRNRL